MKAHSITLIFFITLLFTTTVLSKLRKEKERKKIPSKIMSIDENTNICTIEGNSFPFHCFCSDGATTIKAAKAKCWIFKGLTPEHNLWTLFSTQQFISELNIMVTQMGQLNFVPTKGLQYLKELQSLTITYGSIDDIHPYAFANLTRVYEIILARNKIVNLSYHAFAHLTNLSVLNLDENRISELNKHVFFDLPNLKKLFLKQNNLSVIQEGAFRHLGHLTELELSTNSISVLTKDTFAGLGELKKLMLSYNKISMLGDLTFAELWVLEELDLEANQIEFISDRAFAGLTHLWRLNLSHNMLKSLRGTLLDGVPAIINFDLRHNNLETLTLDSVKPILQNFYNESGYFYLADVSCFAQYFTELYSHQPRLIGGENSTIEEHPYQLSLQWLFDNEYSYVCGASLIKPNLVLTTVVCTRGHKPSQIRIRAGSSYPTRDGIVANVTEIKIHPKHNPDTREYDVAVLVLSQSFPLGPTIQTIPVQLEGEIADGSIGRTTGFGQTSTTLPARVLQKLDMPKVNQEVCKKAYENGLEVTDTMVCFGLMEGGKGPCTNDLGDPVVVNGKLVGLSSWWRGCGAPNSPIVYTNLSNKEIADYLKKCMEDS